MPSNKCFQLFLMDGWMDGWVCQYCNLERKRKFQQYKGMFIMSLLTLH